MASAPQYVDDEDSTHDAPEHLITLTAILDSSGEDIAENVRELVLRSTKYSAFDESCLPLLERLEVLSLSHGCFKTLAQFTCFTNLTEVNLNFNALTSLDGLQQCKALRRLFLSNNRLATLEGLCHFSSLETLCLYNNCITELQGALTVLKRLRKLRSIDLDGNPCARCQGYRHHVVRTLPRLAEVDGERIEALDRDLADMYFKPKPLAADGSSAFGVRPSTAPVFPCGGRRRRPLGPGFRSDSGGAMAAANTIQIGAEVNGGVIAEHDAKRSLASTSISTTLDGDGTTAPEAAAVIKAEIPAELTVESRLEKAMALMPRGEVRLFSTEPLNNDRALLDYLAQDRMENPLGVEREDDSAPAAAAVDPDAGSDDNVNAVAGAAVVAQSARHGSFVRRLRAASSSGNSGGRCSEDSNGIAVGDAAVKSSASPMCSETQKRAQSQAQARARAVTMDPSDPHTTIRKLLRLVELLQQEKEQLEKEVSGTHSSGGLSMETLVSENKKLQTENANMFILLEENANMRAELTSVKSDMAKLQLENKALKAGLPVASSPGQEHAESQFASVADEGAAVLKLSPTHAPAPPAAGIDDSANKESETDGLDDEIELLIRRNASSLRQIRRDVRQAKKQLVMAEAQPLAAEPQQQLQQQHQQSAAKKHRKSRRRTDTAASEEKPHQHAHTQPSLVEF